MLYKLNAKIMDAMRPVHVWSRMTRQSLYQPLNPLNSSWTFRSMRAGLETVERLTDCYETPVWGLDTTEIDGREVAVHYDVIVDRPYCNLLHFRREEAPEGQPTVLLLAPLSGHYATLLRNTVREFLPDHEVYITEWKNARDVPMADGAFHFDDYVEYLIDFCRVLGPNIHAIAVCQPCVPALVAASLMSMDGDPNLPSSMTLMGGPIDVRINPTGVNDYASGKDLEWFEDNVICRVPRDFKGRGQLVYPGFIQLSGFMSMNMDSHVSKHFKFFTDLVKGDGESAEGHRVFYNEYLAVMDMPAHYYLDTIRRVFLDQALPKGEMDYRGRRIDLTAITDMAMMTVEGELDDITGRGQTSCALELCSGIPADRKQHMEAEGVGHYGIFNGRRFRELIAPKIKAFIAEQPIRESQDVAAAESKAGVTDVVKPAAPSAPEPASALARVSDRKPRTLRKPASGKSAENKPAASKPVTGKPAVENKTATSQPAASKPVTSKPKPESSE
ncbi:MULTISPECIES: polyhydroxyalkanoate depolymerase [unclassified Oceanobacter]|uniref:polyhydroxyalkanoate depolymerase n=1 Tax=unclassified Oceanobacter TaxID=2620260 RepID=UPI0027335C40|nr:MULTISPECIES: polyhydroxyalkanoate depolymerase [unclassified Oceanobacter]MDP2546832.1 polyhydroxyalkanoate depolymerase [Oceanobacter sp. 4_MG-2023]MDP2607659.1 polyhydroxyalkanoate depolymerase [Oceanobacter sp. 1_MG-2023]MDP2611157.1 polyhydroxyalkanoate depolymerase [Oceanobacter sp. 2_MG-2023]